MATAVAIEYGAMDESIVVTKGYRLAPPSQSFVNGNVYGYIPSPTYYVIGKQSAVVPQ